MVRFIAAAFFFNLVKSLLLFLPSPEIPNEQPSSQSLSLPVRKNVNCAKKHIFVFFLT